MTDTGDVSQLEELEPLEEIAPPPAAAAPAPTAAVLPAPAYHPGADKEYYRFLFAGVVMLLGCAMPFGPEWDMAGYKTPSGAFFTLIALGIVWSSWASIANRRMIKGMLRWVMLAFLPLVLSIVDLMQAWDAPAVKAYVESGRPIVKSWGEFFGAIPKMFYPEESLKLGNFLRAYGTGRIGVFLGALLAEVFMILAIVGGAKKIQEDKAARRAAASGRRGR